MNRINECCRFTVNDRVQWHTVSYFVRTMLQANVQPKTILKVSQSMVQLFGVKSIAEAEAAAQRCLDCQQSQSTEMDSA